MTGRVHSIESFGTVDGPGLRLVVFLQGCPLRCAYCHNPDTWDVRGGREMSVEEILAQYEKNRAFYGKGGITLSGGEPLLQAEFATALFTACKKAGIHTCLDTSGILFDGSGRFDALLEQTDLVMLDIKHPDADAHKKLTGADNANVLSFARHLGQKGVPLWVRHVVVPGITDDEEQARRLGRFLGTLPTLKALDVLPYHTMGVPKYEELGLDYPLQGVPATDRAVAARMKEAILEGLRQTRKFG